MWPIKVFNSIVQLSSLLPLNLVSNSTILISGASGFLGRHLFSSLKKTTSAPILRMGLSQRAGADVLADLSKRGSWQQSISDLSISHVIHLAGLSRSSNERLLQEIHLDGLRNILEAVQASRPWFLLVSSGAIYGKTPYLDLPIKEEHKLSPITEYGKSKLRQERYLEKVAHLLRGVCIVRPSNLVGPGLGEQFFLGNVVHQINRLRLELDQPRIIRTGSLDSTRDFIDVRDASDAISLLTNSRTTGIFNLSTGQETRLKEAVRLCIPEDMQEISIIQNNSSAKSPIRRQALDNSKLKRTVGWDPQYNLHRSIKDMFGWISRPLGSD